MKSISNSGREKSPRPAAVSVFKGIKGLVASGPGTKKTPDTKKIRPEGAVHIDAGNLKKASGMVAAKPSGVVKPRGSVSVAPGIRPEPGIKRDAAKVVKPFAK